MKEKKNRGIGLIRLIVSILDSTVNIAVLLFFILCLLFSAYSLWDTNHIYTKASPSVYETYKPEKEDTKSFEELVKINPDVYGWISIYGTNIDYPLVQGEDNDKYVNTDAEGNFSLSGSLFLDCNNSKGMSDTVNIIYGHHMEKEKMLGGLDNYTELDYFESHRYGNLYCNGKNYGLDFFMLINVDAYDSKVYNTNEDNIEEYIDYISEYSVQKLSIPESDRLILLSTCSSDSTNGRIVLVGRITEETYKEPEEEKTEVKDEESIDWYHIFLYGIIIVLIICIVIVLIWGHKK